MPDPKAQGKSELPDPRQQTRADAAPDVSDAAKDAIHRDAKIPGVAPIGAALLEHYHNTGEHESEVRDMLKGYGGGPLVVRSLAPGQDPSHGMAYSYRLDGERVVREEINLSHRYENMQPPKLQAPSTRDDLA